MREQVRLVAGTPRLIRAWILHLLDRSVRQEWGQPWWNPDAIAYADTRLPTGGRAFEWGSGSSTVWLRERGLLTTSIESEADWAQKVKASCPDADVRLIAGRQTGTMRSEPQLRDHGEHFFDDYVMAIDEFPDGTFDFVLIDGLCRRECAQRAVTKVKPGGLVAVDDTQWTYLAECFEPFDGWQTTRCRGFKSDSRFYLFETTFFTRPQ